MTVQSSGGAGTGAQWMERSYITRAASDTRQPSGELQGIVASLCECVCIVAITQHRRAVAPSDIHVKKTYSEETFVNVINFTAST